MFCLPTYLIGFEVLLYRSTTNRYITVVIIIVWPHLYYINDFIRNFTPFCASIFLKVVKTCFEANCKLARRDLQRKFVGNYLDLHRRSFSSLVLSHWRFKLSALASKETIMIRLDIIKLQNHFEDTRELIPRQYSECILQANNFQKVFYVYHFIKKVWTENMYVISGYNVHFFRKICQDFL